MKIALKIINFGGPDIVISLKGVWFTGKIWRIHTTKYAIFRKNQRTLGLRNYQRKP